MFCLCFSKSIYIIDYTGIGKIGTPHANCTVVSSGDGDQQGRYICIMLNLLKSITFLLIENLEMVGSAHFRLS